MDCDIDEDIYGDLEITEYQESLLKVEEAQEKLEALNGVIEKLKSDNKKLVQENNVLKRNLQSLLKTASHEIQRKDKELETLRKSQQVRTRHYVPKRNDAVDSGSTKGEDKKPLVDKEELSELFCCDPTVGPCSDHNHSLLGKKDGDIPHERFEKLSPGRGRTSEKRENKNKEAVNERLIRLATNREKDQDKQEHRNKKCVFDRLAPSTSDFHHGRRSTEDLTHGQNRERQRDYDHRKQRHRDNRSRERYRRRSRSKSRSPRRYQPRFRSRSRSPISRNSRDSNDAHRSRSPHRSRHRSRPERGEDRSQDSRSRRQFRGESPKELTPRRNHTRGHHEEKREKSPVRQEFRESEESAFGEEISGNVFEEINVDHSVAKCVNDIEEKSPARQELQESQESELGEDQAGNFFEELNVHHSLAKSVKMKEKESDKEEGERSDSDAFEDALDEEPNTDWQMSFRNKCIRKPTVKTLFTIRMEEKLKREKAAELAGPAISNENRVEPDPSYKSSYKEVTEKVDLTKIDFSAIRNIVSDATAKPAEWNATPITSNELTDRLIDFRAIKNIISDAIAKPAEWNATPIASNESEAVDPGLNHGNSVGGKSVIVSEEKEEGELDDTMQAEVVSSPLKACYKLLELPPVKKCVSLLQFHLGKKGINEAGSADEKLTENGKLMNGSSGDSEKEVNGVDRQDNQFNIEKPMKPLLPTDILSTVFHAQKVESCFSLVPETTSDNVPENPEVGAGEKACNEDHNSKPGFDLKRYTIPKKKSSDKQEKGDTPEKGSNRDEIKDEMKGRKRTRTNSSDKIKKSERSDNSKVELKRLPKRKDLKRSPLESRTSKKEHGIKKKSNEQVDKPKVEAVKPSRLSPRSNTVDAKFKKTTCLNKVDPKPVMPKCDDSEDKTKRGSTRRPVSQTKEVSCKKSKTVDAAEIETTKKDGRDSSHLNFKSTEKVKPLPQANIDLPKSKNINKTVPHAEDAPDASQSKKSTSLNKVDPKPGMLCGDGKDKNKPESTPVSQTKKAICKKSKAAETETLKKDAVNSLHHNLKLTKEVKPVPEANSDIPKTVPHVEDLCRKDLNKTVPDSGEVSVEKSSQIVMDPELLDLLKLVETPTKMDKSSINVITLHGSQEEMPAASRTTCLDVSRSSSSPLLSPSRNRSSSSIENYKIFKNVSSDRSAENGHLRKDLDLSESDSEEDSDDACSASSDEYDSDASDIVSQLF